MLSKYCCVVKILWSGDVDGEPTKPKSILAQVKTMHSLDEVLCGCSLILLSAVACSCLGLR